MLYDRLRKLLAYYLQWLIFKILAQGGTVQHVLWEESPLVPPHRLRVIISRHCKGKLFSFSCKGIVKKQSFKSITMRSHPFGNREGKGIRDAEGT